MRVSRVFGLLTLLLGCAAPGRAQEPPPEEDTGVAGNVVKSGAPLRIAPARPACLLAGAFPIMRAVIEPWGTVETARLFFRPEGYPLWYSVPMDRTPGGFVAVLPKPRLSAQRVRYYVEATAIRQRVRSLEHRAVVVAEAGHCTGEVAGANDSASVTVAVPKGAPQVPPVPPGFIPAGAVGVEAPRRGGARDAIVTAAALGAVVGTALTVHPDLPQTPPPPPGLNPELAVVASDPPSGATLSIGNGAVLNLLLRIRSHQAVHPGQVMVMLYRAAEGPGLPCGVLSVAHDGFLQGNTTQVAVGGPLQQVRRCEPSDRLRITVTQLGSIFMATGATGLPDLLNQYFLVP